MRYLIIPNGNIVSLYRNNNKVLKTRVSNSGYMMVDMRVSKNKITTYVHRVVAKMYVDMGSNYNIVDHIDGDRLNNMHTNLRWCSQLENCNFINNKKFKYGVRTSKYGKFEPRIMVNGKRISLGYYDTLEEAILIRKKYFKKATT